ncbi:hypothetical protein MIND_00494700 [Mycena indigotica]|uniref:Pentatricopeptide repeat-containing protein n=1 Tax=Mycena indigotica TaxID=2126181 RepID=A0A8H6SZ91_9AGAR|nr:uncharacterized protein MIND_00494700 [Mycena indigotica]KAF7307017.1 hypothetical protein MIND_00494700 [Mycena indigotica]
MLRRVANQACKNFFSSCRNIHLQPFSTSIPRPTLGPGAEDAQNYHQTLLTLFLTVPQNHKRLSVIQNSPALREYFCDPEKILQLLYDLASSKTPRTALLAVNLSRQLGHTLGMSAYEVIAYRLGTLKEWELLLYVIRSGKHNTHQTTADLLDWRARGLLETENYTQLFAIPDLYIANGLVPSRRTWHLILSGYVRNHDLAGARECLTKMTAAGHPPNYSTDALISTLYQNIGPDEQVKERGLEALAHIPPRTATHMMNSLMNLRLKIYDLDEVFYLLSAYDQTKVGPLVSLLSATTIQGSRDTDRIRPAFPVIVEPDAITFAMFIDFFAHVHDLSRCLAVVQHMRVSGVDPTLRVVTSLMRAYFLSGQGGAAVRLVSGLCDPGTFSTENLPSPDDYVVPFETAALAPPTRQVFNYLLRGVLGSNGLPGARTVIRLMRANHIKPNSQTGQIIASHMHRVQRAQPRVLMRMVRRFSPRFTLKEAHVILSSTLRFQKYLVDGVGWDVTAAKFSETRMEAERHIPERAMTGVGMSFDPLAGLQVPSRARQRGTFKPIEQSLRGRGIKSDRAAMALRIRHDAVIKGDMPSAAAVFDQMLARGLYPTRHHFSALMEGYAKSGDLDAAIQIMESTTFQPDVVMFTILIVGYARQGEPQMALDTFRRMVGEGIKPDVPVIDAVASAFFFVGAYEMCFRVLTTLWPHIGPLPADINQASLKSAVVYFRSLHNRGHMPKMSLESRRQLSEDLRRLTKEWRQWLLEHPRHRRRKQKKS